MKNKKSLYKNTWFWTTVILFSLLIVITLKVGYFHKVINLFNKNDIQIVSNPEYSRRVSTFEKLEPNNKNIVFLGDSITAEYNWSEKYNSVNYINRGVWGAKINDIAENIDSLNIGTPDKIILLVGVNDIAKGGKIPSVFSDYKKLVTKIKEKFPSSELILTSVFPINENVYTKLNPKNTLTNSSIAEFNDLMNEQIKNIKIIDINKNIIDKENNLKSKYTFDGLHVTEDVYEFWIEELSLQ